MSGDWGGPERRGEVRILSANLVNYAEIASRGELRGPETIYELLGTAKTLDISASGCRLLANQPLPVGAVLDLKLKLADLIIDVRARVIRLRPEGAEFEAGLQFVNLDDVAQDGIRIYLELKGE